MASLSSRFPLGVRPIDHLEGRRRALRRAEGRAHGTQVQKRGATVNMEKAKATGRAAAIKSIEEAEKRKNRRIGNPRP